MLDSRLGIRMEKKPLISNTTSIMVMATDTKRMTFFTLSFISENLEKRGTSR